MQSKSNVNLMMRGTKRRIPNYFAIILVSQSVANRNGDSSSSNRNRSVRVDGVTIGINQWYESLQLNNDWACRLRRATRWRALIDVGIQFKQIPQSHGRATVYNGWQRFTTVVATVCNGLQRFATVCNSLSNNCAKHHATVCNRMQRLRPDLLRPHFGQSDNFN